MTAAQRRNKKSRTHAKHTSPKRKWSKRVTETSDAMDLEAGVFTKDDPHAIAESVKHSAEASPRRKSTPYRSAMSMLTFYANRGGKNLSARMRSVLARAKTELRKLFHRDKPAHA